jgi:hypothetical protein
VDGLWSYCWSCGTSKHGEEDPDFHAWYRKSGGPLAGKSFTEVISVIFSVICLLTFLTFKNSPNVLLAWMIALMALLVLISQFVSMQKMPMSNTAEVKPEPEDLSPVNYDPSCDDFNPADDIAYKLWKAAVFSIESFILFFFAIWLWFKTQQVASSLSQKGCRHYYYSSLFIVLNIMFYGWMITWLIKNHVVLLGRRLFRIR